MKVNVGLKEPMYIDGYLKYNLDIAKKIVRENWDCFFMVDGMEGSGKSLLAFQMAKYCDKTFDNSRVCFTAQEFIDTVKKAKKCQAVVFDESDVGLSSKRSMSQINFALNSTIAQIRQKNLFGFIVCPSFYFIDRRIAVFRSRALIHVYHKNFKRGFFSFYNYNQKMMMYLKDKDYLGYHRKPSFRGRFLNYYAVEQKEYVKRKAISLEVKEEQEIVPKIIKRSHKLIYNLNKKLKYTMKQIADLMDDDVKPGFIGNIVKKVGEGRHLD